MVRKYYHAELLRLRVQEQVIPPIAAGSAVLSVAGMRHQPAVKRVEVRFVGEPPTRQLANASGVSNVETDGSVIHCLVWGSFQPFLEALRGHEVLSLSSIPTEEGVER